MKYYIRILVLLFITSSFFLSCSTKKHSLGSNVSVVNSGFTAYKIQEGDSIINIANKFGINPEVISITNNIYDLQSLRVGMWLRIPNTSSQLASRSSANYISPNYHNTAQSFPPVKKVLNAKTKIVKEKKARIGWPIRTGKYTSGFGDRRGKFHHGIDISAKKGTPIFSANDGVIAYSGSGLRGFGKTVIIKGSKGLYTLYAHASKLYVKKGQKVTRGQKIAAVGSTGRSSGSHLHFEVRTKDKLGRYVVVDPVPLLDRYAKNKPRFKVNSRLDDILARADSHNHNF